MKIALALSGCLLTLVAAAADDVTVSGAPVYVTRGDCQALVTHRPDPDVAYKPGVDVHGKYVAPADLPNTGFTPPPTDHIAFDLKMNPLTFGSGLGQGTRYAQTNVPVGRVVVDNRTGEATFNGQPLDPNDNHVLRDACRKAGYH